MTQNQQVMFKIKNKSVIGLTILLVVSCLISCKINGNKELKKMSKTVIDCFLKDYVKDEFNENNSHYLCIHLGKSDTLFVSKSELRLEIYYIDVKNSFDQKYDNLFTYKKFPVIIQDTSFYNSKIKSLFKGRVPEKLNQSTVRKENHALYWWIYFNKKKEVRMCLPQSDTLLIRSILEPKGIKFAKDYNKNL